MAQPLKTKCLPSPRLKLADKSPSKSPLLWKRSKLSQRRTPTSLKMTMPWLCYQTISTVERMSMPLKIQMPLLRRRNKPSKTPKPKRNSKICKVTTPLPHSLGSSILSRSKRKLKTTKGQLLRKKTKTRMNQSPSQSQRRRPFQKLNQRRKF